MKLILETIYRENYGENGNEYWKNKFGASYVVENITLENGNVNDIDEIIDLINYSNSVSHEEVIGWVVLSDDEELPLENYELSSTVFFKKQDGVWKARKTLDPNNGAEYLREGIVLVTEMWDAQKNNERKNYKVTYSMDDGSFLSNMDELKEWYQVVYTSRIIEDVSVI